jgi:hypothetical protein
MGRRLPCTQVLHSSVRVHAPKVTFVQQRTRRGRMKAGPADIGPEATPEGASVSSDRRKLGYDHSRGEKMATELFIVGSSAWMPPSKVIVAHGGLMKESVKITHHDLTEPDDHLPRSSKATAASGRVRRPTPLIGTRACGSRITRRGSSWSPWLTTWELPTAAGAAA